MPNKLLTTSFNEKILDRGLGTVEYALNNQLHEIQIFITNGDQIYPIAPTAIVELSIEESLSTWATQGTLTIYNANNLSEQDNFIFRNDGEDLLRIRILPRDLNINGLPSLNIEQNKKLWEINHIFSIYNIEDVTPQTSGGSQAKAYKQFKKFYFWDIRFQILLSKNIEYSTAFSPEAIISKTPNAPLTEKNRSIRTGLAVHELIKESLENDSILSKTGFEVDKKKYWDNGSDNIFFTSGADSNCLEDLQYLKSKHTSSILFDENLPDMCNFEIIRDDGIGFFALRPFSKIFSNAGKTSNSPGIDQIEHFYLHADAQEQPQGVTDYKAPISPNFNSTRDITLRDVSFITSYEMVDISPAVNAGDFISYSVNSFDFKERQFNIEFANHSVETAQKIFEEKYISQLYKNKSTRNGNFLLNSTSNSKQTNYNVRPVFNDNGDIDQATRRATTGIYKLLYTGIFQNTCINFTVPGMTLRQKGKFIAIDRPSGSDDINSFDNKLCGQWYVINVIHTISNGAYYNNITAVKIHRYK